MLPFPPRVTPDAFASMLRHFWLVGTVVALLAAAIVTAFGPPVFFV